MVNINVVRTVKGQKEIRNGKATYVLARKRDYEALSSTDLQNMINEANFDKQNTERNIAELQIHLNYMKSEILELEALLRIALRDETASPK